MKIPKFKNKVIRFILVCIMYADHDPREIYHLYNWINSNSNDDWYKFIGMGYYLNGYKPHLF